MQEILHRLIGSVYPTTLLSFQCSTSHNNFAHNAPHLRFTIFVHASFTERERRIDVRASTWKLLETLASTIIHRQTKKTASVRAICENVTSPSQSKCPSVKITSKSFEAGDGFMWPFDVIWIMLWYPARSCLKGPSDASRAPFTKQVVLESHVFAL